MLTFPFHENDYEILTPAFRMKIASVDLCRSCSIWYLLSSNGCQSRNYSPSLVMLDASLNVKTTRIHDIMTYTPIRTIEYLQFHLISYKMIHSALLPEG